MSHTTSQNHVNKRLSWFCLPPNPAPTPLQQATDLARAALTRDSCRKLFSGIDPIRLLDDLTRGNTGIGSIRAADLGGPSGRTFTNAITNPVLGSRTITGSQGQPIRQSIITGATITINSNSAAPFQAGYGGRFGANDDVNRAVTLIHELGHAAAYIYGRTSSGVFNDPPGPLGSIASQLNSERVYRDCFEDTNLVLCN